MNNSQPFGELLIDLNFITHEQLDVALDIQKVHPAYIGEILLSFDFITTSEIARALCIQHHIDYLDIQHLLSEEQALKKLPKDMAISKNILPYKLTKETLYVCVANPVEDMPIITILKKNLSLDIHVSLSDKDAIAKTLRYRYYTLENPIKQKIDLLNKSVLEDKTIDATELSEPIINHAIIDKATDIHITPDQLTTHIFYRIDGVLQHYSSLPPSIHKQLIAKIKILSHLDIAQTRIPQDGTFEYTFVNEAYDIRVSTLPTAHGENIVLRILQKSAALHALDTLGLDNTQIQKVSEIFTKPYGTVLVVGPTGSGKTTTMYSAIREINALQKNILTVEDPIEYKFSFLRQTQINNKAGYTFSKAIKHFMRQDPDVILVGEIRDEETADLAMKASLTGHLVLSTLHTNDATSTINRLLDMGIKEYIIASSLVAIIAQRLVRQVCQHCRIPVSYSKKELLLMGFKEKILVGNTEFILYDAQGCEHCRNTGYSGRKAIIEILEIDAKIKEMISQKEGIMHIEDYAKEKGMVTLIENGYMSVLRGETTMQEIQRIIIS